MHVGLLTLELRFPEAQSLKDKRQILKSALDIARRKFNVSISEVDALNEWRRAIVGAASVANDSHFVNQVLDKVVDQFESNPLLDVASVAIEML